MTHSIILDANKMGELVGKAQGRSTVRRLSSAIISGELRVAFGGTKLKDEYERVNAMMDLIQELERSGQLDRGGDTAVDAEQRVVEGLDLHSDDPHILALARITRGRVLVSEDKNLQKDFVRKDLIDGPRGFVYVSDTNWAAMKRRFAQ